MKAKLQRVLPGLNFDGVALADVLDFLTDVSGVSIRPDWKAIEKAGVGRNTPVTADLQNVTLAVALTDLLDMAAKQPGKLTYTVKDGARSTWRRNEPTRGGGGSRGRVLRP